MTDQKSSKEYIIFLGNFGSGKTELALHFAYASAEAGNPTTLIDLDMINPYFRVSERQHCLEKAGISLISPSFAMSNVEIITVNPRIYSAFVGEVGTAIFDVGGDGNGARALGQYKEYFEKIPAEKLKVWLVVNPSRPMSATPQLIVSMMRSIEENSRLKITGLINNGNMSYESSGKELMKAYEVIKEVSQETKIPVIMTSGEDAPLQEFLVQSNESRLEKEYIGELVTIHTRMHRDWHRFVKLGV